MVGSLARLGFIAIVLATALASAQPTAARQREGVRRADAMLRERLTTAYAARMGAHHIQVDTYERSFGTMVFARVMPVLWGGEGRASIVVGTDGHLYGAHGGRDVASLVRALGWIDHAAPPGDLLDLVSATLFDYALDANAHPTFLHTDGGALRVTLFSLPSARATRYEQVVIDFPRRGTARVRHRALDP